VAHKELGQTHEGTVTQNLVFVLTHVEDEYETELHCETIGAWVMETETATVRVAGGLEI
jgi:hypothetical protein